MTMPLFRNGFRPFFLGSSLFVALVVPVWIGLFTGNLSALRPLEWHAHEMVFGFFAGIMGGFLLTAMPNWTSRPPLAGRHLILLFAAWLAGRLAMAALLLGGLDSPILFAIIDETYLVLLAFYAINQVRHAPAIHNMPVVAMIVLLAVANLLFHLTSWTGWSPILGPHLGLAIAASLLTLIGGRVIPAFTRNWLAARSTTPPPVDFNRFDGLTVLVTITAMLAWIWSAEAVPTGWLLGLAALLNAIRLTRWRGWHTRAEPLLFILHLGYGWLVAALTLLALNVWWPHPGAMHALTAGAMGVMILAIMTRATRGHTGRPLSADRTTVIIYVLVNAGALLRVAAGYLPMDYAIVAALGGISWCAAYLLFATTYGRWLCNTKMR